MIQFSLMINYLKVNSIKESEIKSFVAILNKANPNIKTKEYLSALPKNLNTEIENITAPIMKTYRSQGFKEMVSSLKKGDYKSISAKLDVMNDSERANALYLIFSTI